LSSLSANAVDLVNFGSPHTCAQAGPGPGVTSARRCSTGKCSNTAIPQPSAGKVFNPSASLSAPPRGFFDFNKARPGKRGLVPEFPPILVKLVSHLMEKGYLPHDVKPDSCIINQYGEGDCIPPHVDHESYQRPISTLSLLGEEAMLLGTKFKTVKNCTWKPIVGQSVLLPRRSLLVLGGNSGNVSKHCISACTRRRISITLRKQPPPDWVPRSNHLAKSVEIKTGDPSNQDTMPPKKKALSGSAKRRKKMMKQHGITQDGAPQRQVEPANEDAKPASKKERKSEKQARRNARRLAKKTEAAIET